MRAIDQQCTIPPKLTSMPTMSVGPGRGRPKGLRSTLGIADAVADSKPVESMMAQGPMTSAPPLGRASCACIPRSAGDAADLLAWNWRPPLMSRAARCKGVKDSFKTASVGPRFEAMLFEVVNATTI
jgi:hypothetical protein